MHLMPANKRSVFPVRNPDDPNDAAVQIMLRVPHWYRTKLQKLDPKSSVPSICLDLIGQHVTRDKPRSRKAAK